MSALVLDHDDPSRPVGPSLPEEPALRSPGTKVVAILDGGPMVARVLDLLLRGSGYGTRLLEEADVERPGALPLGSVDLLLLAPGPSREHTEAILSAVKSEPETAHLPVLVMLSGVPQGSAVEGARIVAWPCRTEELVREIEAALTPGTPRD